MPKPTATLTGPNRSPAARKEQAKDEELLLQLVCQPPPDCQMPDVDDDEESDRDSDRDLFTDDEQPGDDNNQRPDVEAEALNSSFDGKLSAFLKESRLKEERKRQKFNELESASQRHVEALKKKKAVITNSAQMSFDQRFKSLLRAFDVDGERGPNANANRISKTSLAVKCVASEYTREKLGAAIDKKVYEIANNVLEKKRSYYKFLCDELGQRERVWNMARSSQLSMATEYDSLLTRFHDTDPGNLQGDEQADYVKYQLMRDVHEAQKNLQEYKEEETRADKEIRKLNRKRVAAPSKAGSPPKKLRVHDSRRKSEAEVTEQASLNIAKFCKDWQDGMRGYVLVPNEKPGGADKSETPPGDPQFVHEEELLSFLSPRNLQTAGWNTAAKEETDAGSGTAGILSKILARIDEIQKVQHLHSLALQTAIDAVGNVRLAVARDGNQQAQLAKELKAAQRATLLASDSHLKSLPFRSVPDIDDFFLDSGRVAKLAKYLCTYVRYSKKYQQDVNAALLHPDLQARVYWPGTMMRGYG